MEKSWNCLSEIITVESFTQKYFISYVYHLQSIVININRVLKYLYIVYMYFAPSVSLKIARLTICFSNAFPIIIQSRRVSRESLYANGYLFVSLDFRQIPGCPAIDYHRFRRTCAGRCRCWTASQRKGNARAVAARLWTGFRDGKKKKERPSAGNNNFNRHPDQDPALTGRGGSGSPSHIHAFARAFARCRRYALAETDRALFDKVHTHVYIYTHSIPGERKTRAPTTFGFGDRRRRIPLAGETRIAAGDTKSFRGIPLFEHVNDQASAK